jgi:SAM-dependent methyltransferase
VQAKRSDWYRYGWTLDAKTQSWTENTEHEVDFIIRTLGLTGKERILDLACGFGRHALSLARRGFSVVGVDITQAYVEDATRNAEQQGMNASFICADIRDLDFRDEFDVVLNLADGAIGYLESDAENLKIFDVVARSLRSSGRSFMDVGNAEHADHYFPKRHWEAGESALALAEFDWDRKTRVMLYGGHDIPYGVPAARPEILYGDPTRLYTIGELRAILGERQMTIVDAFCNYDGKPASYRDYQLMVHSKKE